MRLYKTVRHTPAAVGEGSSRTLWSGSQASAGKDRDTMRKSKGLDDTIETTEVDVPTTKPEMLNWLNKWNVLGQAE